MVCSMWTLAPVCVVTRSQASGESGMALIDTPTLAYYAVELMGRSDLAWLHSRLGLWGKCWLGRSRLGLPA